MTKKEKQTLKEEIALTKWCIEAAQAAKKIAAKKNDLESFGFQTGMIEGYINYINLCKELLGEEK